MKFLLRSGEDKGVCPEMQKPVRNAVLARMGRICLVPSSVLPVTLKDQKSFCVVFTFGEKNIFFVLN